MAAGASSRLPRFEKSRFIGARDTMIVYDCDDAHQFARLETRLEDDGLLGRNLIQSFAPDTLAEARNRGFRSV
ncbi:hypothetical protein [Candidatus Spongiisocius sp.]|uniref:hypothetical protein n=1 Tax=Candidatus Spongiisocius sp. TaxID=3101273 RepID=UPI003B5C1318